jgi:hypothetical protein
VLVILVPVLDRPHRVSPLLASIRAATPSARVLFICDPDDHAEQSAVREHALEPLIVDGNYARKINAGSRATTEPLIFLGADDLHFHPGWFEAATTHLTDGIGVVGTNDLCNRRVIRGDHSTHSLVTRDYLKRGTIDEPDKLLHEAYPHEYVDDEFVQTAQTRSAYAHAHDAIVEHLHPMAGKAPMDHLYAAQRQRMRRGRRIYLARRPLWTSPSSSPPTARTTG